MVEYSKTIAIFDVFRSFAKVQDWKYVATLEEARISFTKEFDGKSFDVRISITFEDKEDLLFGWGLTINEGEHKNRTEYSPCNEFEYIVWQLTLVNEKLEECAFNSLLFDGNS